MPSPVESVAIPETGLELLHGPNLGHVSFIDGKGRIVTAILWIHEVDGRVLTSSPVGSAKGRAYRERPQVAVSVVDPANPFHYVSISGEVTGIRPDEGLAFIDEMSRKYNGTDYEQRDLEREVFEITPTHVRASTGTW
jgi:PPOX class probable F420-dependent enzyme